jgi:hypothetical protein
MADESTGTHPTQAAGQYLGYAMQSIVFLLELINGEEDSTISLEYFSDVGVETGGAKASIEVKSGLQINPIADRAVGLWKTLSNWIKSIEAGHLDLASTAFILHVVQPKDGRIAKSFHDAATLAQATEAFVIARKGLLEDKDHPPGNDLAPFLQHFFANERTAKELIQRFRLRFGSGDSQSDLEKALTAKYILPEQLQAVLHQLQGWVNAQINTALEQRRPAAVSVEAFRGEVIAAVRKYNLHAVLVTYAPNPTKEQIAANQASTFVRQLDLIGCEDEHQLRAINDYFKAAVDRTEWGKLGMVHRSSFDELEEALVRYWENKKEQVELAYSNLDEPKRGNFLYRECVNHSRPLQGMETPAHFIPGSYHALADTIVVGWHPNYAGLLKKT